MIFRSNAKLGDRLVMRGDFCYFFFGGNDLREGFGGFNSSFFRNFTPPPLLVLRFVCTGLVIVNDLGTLVN